MATSFQSIPDPDPRSGGEDKQRQLDGARYDPQDTALTTNQGVRVDHTDDSLTVGERGPTLLEDFHAREKIMHFDHERIPERVVHARGSGAYGYFQPYDDRLSEYTVARFLTEPAVQTPVFVRFSTVAGFKGSGDTVRDVRGFATKFYTAQGNYDLVGNNFPVFFIHDGIKFPDFVHAVKPEPQAAIPQAQSAHDTLWDFVSLQPEAQHAIMWLMSDRAIPRSYRTMQGFGVHTFRFVNADGQGTFVKFHWTPVLGTHSLVWDEAQKIQGKDPDFNRRDLWEAIEKGAFPEYELGVQLVPESDEHNFDFDLLDATKIIPEEQVPVRPVGKMVLNRNPDNFFAETEQVAFHTANIVPGIDFTNDPLLQTRNFSYLDTQLNRFGSANFHHLPVNRAVAPVSNNQRDGFMQMQIHQGRAPYYKNSLQGGCPAIADSEVFRHYQERVDGEKIRKRSPSFQEYYSQATLFWNSMAGWEREHIVAAYRFELNKCDHMHVREQQIEQLNHIDHDLAVAVAEGVGVTAPADVPKPNHGHTSPALSQANTTFGSVLSRKVAILVADGADPAAAELARALSARGALPELLAPTAGPVRDSQGADVAVDRAINSMASVVYDAVVVPGGPDSAETLGQDGYATHFVTEAIKHAKAIGALGAGTRLVARAANGTARVEAEGDRVSTDLGVVSAPAVTDSVPDEFVDAFCEVLGLHRAWERHTDSLPA
ncbi:catalase [Pseudonocardia parietis]|uniref:Catalase n=1 Tax=Pseudonocardia parietis TaxID=570936 RepID=A0ABS4VXU8_9PSEU|nr:catalase [Pseudonocardia parietis]MBP2368558.1 catalase [Pseudonocardia parietis]